MLRSPMNTFKFKAHALSGLFFFLLLIHPSFGSEETALRLKNPFELPQLNLVTEDSTETVEIYNSVASKTFTFNQGGLLGKSKLGFDLEVNANEFTNIGLSFRWKQMIFKGQNFFDDTHNVSALMGGFVRFFYIPSFLKYKSKTANLFTRLDLSMGPSVISDCVGIVGQGSISIGTEIFLSKWFGLGLSYSHHALYGLETLARNSGSAQLPAKFRDVKFSGHGNSVLLYLKSTYY